MDQQRQEQTDEIKSAESKAKWLRPELCRFEAGAAEFGDVSSADAQPGFS